MSNPQGPINRGWSLLWLLAAASVVIWFLVRVLEQIWPWLLGALIVAACLWVSVAWLRSRGRL